jgi:hypothetical protein
MMHGDETHDLQLLKAEIASRLKTACAHFPAREFEDLVSQIAHVELKYARRIAPTPVDAA